MDISRALQLKIVEANARAVKRAGSSAANKRKCYIAGKVGNLTDDDYYYEVQRKFARRELELRKLGYSPVNPVKLVKRGTDWNTAMRICISEMMLCDYISPLADCEQSPGATIEMELAAKLEFTLVFPSRINSRIYKDTE